MYAQKQQKPITMKKQHQAIFSVLLATRFHTLSVIEMATLFF